MKSDSRRRRPLATIAAAMLFGAPAGGASGFANPLPGAPAFPEAVAKKLAAAVAAKGAGYEPRTRNRQPDGSPTFTNRLVLETSPYLQQHAHNPVNWYPWGDEAFAAARKRDRPVLVSIGYSTCHWCHVMEEESFDDPGLAAFLNEHFIAIKVDRETRPDIDAVYMAAVHAMNRRGGWPLNVWLTPDRKPFYGGTYFPPEDRAGRPGFRSVLDTIRTQYEQQPERVARISEQIASEIARHLEGYAANASQTPERAAVDRSAREFTARIDRTWGGIGRGTKFPSTVPVRLLLRAQHRTGDRETRRLVELTLDRMAAGGVRDQIGGGFHRYSTEPRWLVPHFEMMLYDNALIAQAYTEAFQATGREDYARVAADTLDYLLRDMRAPEGGFYSATDADSLRPDGHSEEGFYFTWTPAEIEAAVGERDAAVVNAYYGVTPEGNFESRNILHVWKTHEEVAAEIGTTAAAVRATIAAARTALYEARRARTRPARDEKILASWNGLAISSLARAGFALDDGRYTEAARKAAAFVLEQMRTNGRLQRVYKDGRVDGPSFLEDYAFLIAGLLDLYEADANPRWLREAIALQGVLDEHYLDEIRGGYFKTADDQAKLLAREKPGSDGAIPAGNSVAAMNLLRLAEFTSDEDALDRALLVFAAFHEVTTQRPTQLPEMLMAVEFFLSTTKQIVLVHPASHDNAEAMMKTLRANYTPNRIVAVVTEGPQLDSQAELVPLVAGRAARSGKTTAYVCENRVCRFPTADPEEFGKQLRRREGEQ